MLFYLPCSYSHARIGPALGICEAYTRLLGASKSRCIMEHSSNLGVGDCVPVLHNPYTSGLWRSGGPHTVTSGRLVSYGRAAKVERLGNSVWLPEDPGNNKKAD